MYNILLVDDEPLILSGIKFLLSQLEQEGFALAGCARNGRQALEMIEEVCPDIVVCDINMPIMSGLELLQRMSEQDNPPAFVMLTNHEEFDMARLSLRYKAVDYLLKSQLDEKTFLAALQRAKAFCDQREAVLHIQAAPERRDRAIASNVERMLEQGKVLPDSMDALRKDQGLEGYGLIRILLDYGRIPNIREFCEWDLSRIYDSILGIVDTMLPRVFRGYVMLPSEEPNRMISVYFWNEQNAGFQERMLAFFSQLTASCGSLTPTRIRLLCSSTHASEHSFQVLLSETADLLQYSYIAAEDYLTTPVPAISYKSISAGGLSSKLASALRAKDTQQCKRLLEKAQSVLADIPHSRRSGIAYCAELYSTAATLLASAAGGDEAFTNVSAGIQRLNRMMNREQLLLWLEEFARGVVSRLEQLNAKRPALIEDVRGYVMEHIDRQIRLSDVAEFVNMAPGYLSASFHKRYAKTLFDFINEVKMQQACKLMTNRELRVYEVSYMLGYDSAYYFGKVFKRYTGKTPREYLAMLDNEERKPK